MDIFGFENFVHNSFEQLCINFANEKLHQLFLYTMFKAEEAVIARERGQLPQVEYCDNYRCLQLLEDTPNGIFHLLDTCCRVPSTPASFCLQVHEVHLSECEFLVPSINRCSTSTSLPFPFPLRSCPSRSLPLNQQRQRGPRLYCTPLCGGCRVPSRRLYAKEHRDDGDADKAAATRCRRPLLP